MTAPPTAARSSVTVSIWTLVSRVTGLLRVVVIGAVLGPTFFANAFLTANSVPNLAYTAMAGQVLILVLVPAVVRALTEHGVGAAADLVRRISGYLLSVAAAAAVALACASPLVAFAVTAGIPDPAERAQAWRLTVLVLLFVTPQVLGYTVAGIGEAVQQARGRFALAAAAPALESIGVIATMAVVALSYRSGLPVAEVPIGMVLTLGIGCTLSVAVHAAAQVWGARRAGLSIRPARGWRRDPAAAEVTRRLRRSVVVAVFPPLSMFAMLAIASTVPGGTFVFQAGMSVFFVISALGAKAVTVAVLPGMSAAARAGDDTRFGGAWRQALSLAFTASLPAAFLLLAFAVPVAQVLANGSLRTPEILSWLTGVLVVFAVAQLANAVNEISRQALFARLDVRNPRRISTVTLALRVGVGLACLLLPPDGYRLAGLAAAVLVGEAAAGALGVLTIRRAIRPERVLDRARLARVGLASVTMLPAAGLGWWLVRTEVQERLAQIGVAVGLGAVSAGCFVLTLAAVTGRLPPLLAKMGLGRHAD